MRGTAPVRRVVTAAAAMLVFWAGSIGMGVAQTPFDSSFDHLSTAWPLEGSHRYADCASCHVGGIFEGTPRQCVACHSRAGLVKATAPSVRHIRTTDECEACHRETTWSYVRPVDHNAVVGTCFSCHNGLTATGKPPTHIPTSSDCGECHSTRAWTPAG